MRRRLRTLLELLPVTLFAAPLITPLLRWTLSACTHDGHLHYHRVVAMLHAWRNGLFFSRWLPDLAFGYGYPFFLYREPLPLYLSLWPHLLGLPLPASINLFYIVCIVAAGWFTYLWVRDIFGARAAVVSAVAYMAAPYQLIDALVRGNQVESMALALFPFILWAGRRFMRRGQARWFLAATLGLAMLALSHNISTLLFTPMLVLYLLFSGWLAGLERKAIVGRAALLVGLPLLMTSFYTVPAVLEIDEVTLTLSTSNRNNDFRFNFATLAEIFSPVTPEDPELINPPLPLRLGWAPAGLALLGLLSYARQKGREQKAHILFMGAGAVVTLFFALATSNPLWELIPLIEFVQFPWRFVGRAALPVSVLAGAPFAASVLPLRITPGARPQAPAPGAGGGGFAHTILGILPMAAAVTLLLLEAIPLLYPAYCVEAPYPTIHDVHQYEQNSGMVGVDPVGSYFPVTVVERPRSSPLLEDYAAGRPPQRFDASALPEEAELLAANYEPLRAEIVVQSPRPFQARYLTFAFPGWSATVDGEAVTVTPEDPSGLITFPVSSGRHTLVVSWGLTPLRAAVGLLSAVAALGVVAAAFVLRRIAPAVAQEPPATPVQSRGAVPSLSRRGLWLLALLALLILSFKLLLVDRRPTPLRRSAPPPVAVESDLAAGGLRLAGYNLSQTSAPSGGQFDIDLAWQVQGTPTQALQSNVWLRDEEGLIWSERETFRPRIYEDAPPTQQWLPGQWAWDSRELHILSGTPPGRYQIVLTLFDLADLQPLTLLENGSAVGPTAVIGEIEITRPDSPPQFRPQQPLSRELQGLHLLGFNQDRRQAQVGDPLLLTLFWEKAHASPQAAATLALTLRDSQGAVQRTWQIAPVRPSYPPAQWQAQERLRGQHLLRLPAALESGDYQLWLEDVALGHLQIEAPDRLFAEPPYRFAIGETFGGAARLNGASLAPASSLAALDAAQQSLTVTLVWQALQEMETSYHVFVHLVNGAGEIVAQADGEPAQWARPTTGWAPQEFIVDEHVLALPASLPPGDLALRAGLYDPDSGQRLQTADGGSFVQFQP